MIHERLFLSTRKSKLIEWVEKWKRQHFCGVFPVGVSCCNQELSSLFVDETNLSPELGDVSHAPELSDILIIGGVITQKYKPYL